MKNSGLSETSRPLFENPKPGLKSFLKIRKIRARDLHVWIYTILNSVTDLINLIMPLEVRRQKLFHLYAFVRVLRCRKNSLRNTVRSNLNLTSSCRTIAGMWISIANLFSWYNLYSISRNNLCKFYQHLNTSYVKTTVYTLPVGKHANRKMYQTLNSFQGLSDFAISN